MTYTTPTVAQYMTENVPEHLHCAFETAVLRSPLLVHFTGKHSTLEIQMFKDDLDAILHELQEDYQELIADIGC